MWCAIILAGGTASRMQPLSQYMPKGMLPIEDKPIIIHHLERFESVGIKQIIIVLEPNLGPIIEQAITRGYKGYAWIRFLYQDKSQGYGPGYAVLHCENFINNGDTLLVYLSDELHQHEKFARSVVYRKREFVCQKVDAAVAVAQFSPTYLTKVGNVYFDEHTDLIWKYLDKPQLKDISSEWGTTGGWAFFNTQKLFNTLHVIKRDPYFEGIDLHLSIVVQKMIDTRARVLAFKEGKNRHYHFNDISGFWESALYAHY